jgi:hypothetical protein
MQDQNTSAAGTPNGLIFYGLPHGIVRTTGDTVCWANCDHSLAEPVLNALDFTCFLQKFASGDPYANCDHSVRQPVLNIADFTCYLQRFAQGCLAVELQNPPVQVVSGGGMLNWQDAQGWSVMGARPTHPADSGESFGGDVWPNSLGELIVNWSSPVSLKLDWRVKHTIITDHWTSEGWLTRPITVLLRRPQDWQASMVPPDEVVDLRTPQPLRAPLPTLEPVPEPRKPEAVTAVPTERPGDAPGPVISRTTGGAVIGIVAATGAIALWTRRKRA